MSIILCVIFTTGWYFGYIYEIHNNPPQFLMLKYGSFVNVGGVFFSYGLDQWTGPLSTDPYNVQITAAQSTYYFNSTVKQGDILTFPRWGQYKVTYLDKYFISVELVK
jgi:hypothetical protein